MTAAMTRQTALVGLMLLAVASAVAQEPSAERPSQAQSAVNAPSSEDIERWIAELDSDVFDNREAATLKLISAEAAAIEPVTRVLEQSGSLEVTTRGLLVLKELGLSDDLDVQDASRTALEKLAATPTSIGRRAKTSIAQLNRQRSAQTIAALEKLGAVVTRFGDEAELGASQPVDSIQIGDDWRGTEKDYRRLKWIQDVDELVLAGGKISDAILPYVASIDGLKRLHLYRTKITDEGLAAIGSLESLTQIGVYYSPIGDPAVETLKRLPSLSTVKLYGTKITLSEDQLKESLRTSSIDLRRGAFLGVSCQTLGEQCELATVHEGSPAFKAGLMPGDIILTFAGKRVTSFDAPQTGLTEIISQHGVDDVVEVEFSRRTIDENGHDSGEQTLKTKVTLGEWAVDLAQKQPVRP